MTRFRDLEARVTHLEREAARETCPCGGSDVHASIAAAVDRATDPTVPVTCRACRGPLPRIPFAMARQAIG